ncbi:MAG: RNA-binding S4 domain-containing protein [Acidimicrobiales bacterium]
MSTDTTRVDKWLWSVRAYKTRTQAGDACTTGKVLVNGEIAKPATKIRVGDEVTARRRDRTLVFGVVEIIEKRVSAAKAATCIDDRSPALPPRDPTDPFVGAFAQRDRGTGRPTKRDRRDIERLRGGT